MDLFKCGLIRTAFTRAFDPCPIFPAAVKVDGVGNEKSTSLRKVGARRFGRSWIEKFRTLHRNFSAKSEWISTEAVLKCSPRRDLSNPRVRFLLPPREAAWEPEIDECERLFEAAVLAKRRTKNDLFELRFLSEISAQRGK